MKISYGVYARARMIGVRMIGKFVLLYFSSKLFPVFLPSPGGGPEDRRSCRSFAREVLLRSRSLSTTLTTTFILIILLSPYSHLMTRC
jgi:hypothetical protein